MYETETENILKISFADFFDFLQQQLSNVAVHTSNERRLFTAVAGLKSKQGELFGLKNLFMLRREASNFTNDVIKRTENIESGVRMVKYEIKPVASQDSEVLQIIPVNSNATCFIYESFLSVNFFAYLTLIFLTK